MSVLASVLFILGGLVALAAGGELLVRGAVTVARQLGLAPAVIGLTVVAMGTSLPELVVSATAALEGQPDISVGNVVGSNIFNILAVLGLAAMFAPLEVIGSAVRREWPVMFVASVALPLAALGGIISAAEGVIGLVCLAAFVYYSVRVARSEMTGEESSEFSEEVELREGRRSRTMLTAVVFVVAGLAALVAGGRLLVDGAVELARLAGLTERVIGLTIVAAGTGMPELAATVVAVFRRHTDVAVANMIGSNIFNILGILGATALITPIPVSAEMLRSDVWWMIGSALVLFPLMRTGFRISRREGALLVGVYVLYIWLLLR